MQVIRGKGWVRLSVANPVTIAPNPHLLRTGPGHPVCGGRWAVPSNSENGSEPPASVFEIFIFILKVKVKSAYGQENLPTTGLMARIRAHFRK